MHRSATHRFRLATLAILGLLGLFSAVLGTGIASAAPAQSGDPYHLVAGKTYRSVAVIGGAIPGGGPLTVSFGDHRIGLNAGCNQHAGVVRMAGDQMMVGRTISTMMACPGMRGHADSWVTSFVSPRLLWRVAGPVLQLSSPVQTVILVEQPARR